MGRQIIALGGNAITPDDGTAEIDAMRERIRATAELLAPVIAGRDVVLTHGNGPQVGALLAESDRPLDVLVAETQGQIGYLLQQALDRETGERFVTAVTRVVVDPDDPAFSAPSKPVGPWLDRESAEALDAETRQLRDAADGYRRVVPSPEPRGIVEQDAIAAMVADGTGVICCGGGGVPVGPDGNGVEAVVDKDRTAAFLGSELDADTLVLLTDVAAAERRHGTADAEPIGRVSADELEELLDAGAFGPGSMRPKVEACIGFIRDGGQRSIITDAPHLQDALDGDAGTRVTS